MGWMASSRRLALMHVTSPVMVLIVLSVTPLLDRVVAVTKAEYRTSLPRKVYTLLYRSYRLPEARTAAAAVPSKALAMRVVDACIIHMVDTAMVSPRP